MGIDQNASPPPAAADPDAEAPPAPLELDEPPEGGQSGRGWHYVDGAIDWLWRNWPSLLVAAGVFWYFEYFARLTTDIQHGYGTSAFDIGVFDQGVWLMSRFHVPFVTITGRNLFADHTSFILIAVAPLYWLFPSPSTLLVLQAAGLALAAVPIYLVGKKRIGAPLAAFLALAYLLHPAVGASNMENFHPDSFIALFVAMALYAAIEDRRWLFIVSCVLCLLVKEDAILVVLPMAIWFAWRRNIRSA